MCLRGYHMPPFETMQSYHYSRPHIRSGISNAFEVYNKYGDLTCLLF